MNKRIFQLPSLKNDTKLPVILNYAELKQLFKAPQLLKQRILLSLIYSAGLRGQEAINLKISDVDFERKTIHIRQSKYKKDRIVPLSDYMAVGLKKYLRAENPYLWFFNGKDPSGKYSVRGLAWVMRETLKKTNIKQLSTTFKGKFINSIRRQLNQRNMLDEFSQSIDQAYQTPWVVFSESSLADVEHVIGYLGQYTHRIAISNKRILSINNDRVNFLSRDYRDKGMEKTVSLQGTEFLRRFLLHVFPKGFVRIRRYGIYNVRFYHSVDQSFPGIPNKLTRETESRINSETHPQRMVR